MKKSKNMAVEELLKELSADELKQLIQKKEEEERIQQEEALREELKHLRSERRALRARQKRELEQLDRKIERLSEQLAGRGKRKRSAGNISKAVLEIIAEAGTITTTELKQALEQKGIVPANLSQTLAYLKRNGRICSPARATYEIAGN